MTIPNFSVLTWILLSSLLGGTLSVLGAALVALNVSKVRVPMFISYAIGAMLGAVFLDILPEAIKAAGNPLSMTATMLFGILLFFALEKLVIWRHCHGDHCEVHAPHDELECPDHEEEESPQTVFGNTVTKFKPVTKKQPAITAKVAHLHDHDHDHGRSGIMIMIGDTFHNFVDGVLLTSAFMVDIKVGIVTSIAIIAHEIPQEIGDFLILLHSGYSKKQALVFNLISSVATAVGGSIAYFALKNVQSIVPNILGLAAASLLYVSVADLIPSLHKRTELRATVSQLLLISLGVASIALTTFILE
jgi:zinc and cadmium transporter